MELAEEVAALITDEERKSHQRQMLKFIQDMQDQGLLEQPTYKLAPHTVTPPQVLAAFWGD